MNEVNGRNSSAHREIFNLLRQPLNNIIVMRCSYIRELNNSAVNILNGTMYHNKMRTKRVVKIWVSVGMEYFMSELSRVKMPKRPNPTPQFLFSLIFVCCY